MTLWKAGKGVKIVERGLLIRSLSLRLIGTSTWGRISEGSRGLDRFKYRFRRRSRRKNRGSLGAIQGGTGLKGSLSNRVPPGGRSLCEKKTFKIRTRVDHGG